MYYYYDYSWFVLIPALIFTFITQARISSAYRTYSRVANSRGITGGDAARRMMDANGLGNVQIKIVNGGNSLVNFYDPKTKTLNLSREVYSTPSIASMCIACHEVGHAIQDATHYAPLTFRNNIVPLVNLTQMMSWPLIFFGLVMSTMSPYGSMMFLIGVGCFLFVILFHLVTLPVEFNASARALKTIKANHFLTEEEYPGASRTLRAAAMTYVAAAATAILQLLRLVLIATNRRR